MTLIEQIRAEIVHRMRTWHCESFVEEMRCEDGFLDYLAKLEREQPDGVDAVVHHYAFAHYLTTNEDQLAARLKEFPDGEEVKVYIVKK